MDFELISIVAFFTLVAVLLWRDRKKIEFKHGIVIRKMQQGGKALDNLVKRRERFFRILGDIGVIAAIITAFAGTALLIIFPIFRQTPSIAPVLPTVSNYQYPGPIVSVPIWYWLIAVFVIMATHETMHAIMTRLAGINIKNYGFIFFLVLPIGAFVDPDMKKIARLKLTQKLRIYAAGSFGNFITALIVIALFFSSVWINNNMIEGVGVKFESTLEGTPARDVNLNGIIYEIDGVSIKTQSELRDVLNKTEPGKKIKILTTEGEFELTTIESPYFANMSYLGIENTKTDYRYKLGVFAGRVVPDALIDSIVFWYGLLSWLFVLSLGIAIVNLLPMKPLDGGLIFEEFAKKYFGKFGKQLTKIASVFIAMLLIFNLFILHLLKYLLSSIF